MLALARTKDDLNSLAAEKSGILPTVLDLTDPEQIDEILDPLLEEHGPVSLLVNNAGYGMRGAIEDSPMAEVRRLFEVNLFSLLHLTQKVLPGMRRARQGVIVNVSSVAGLASTPFGGIYSASKFALEAASDALRLEARPFGIHVVLVEPGPVTTNFTTAAAEVSDPILNRRESAYHRYYKKLQETVSWVHDKSVSAEVVAGTILQASQSPRPKARYRVHKLLFYVPPFLRRFFPSWVLDRILAGRLGLSGQ